MAATMAATMASGARGDFPIERITYFDVEKWDEDPKKVFQWGACTSVVVSNVVKPRADGAVDFDIQRFELAKVQNTDEAQTVLEELAAAFPAPPSPSELCVLAGAKSLDLAGVRVPVLRKQTKLCAYVSCTGTETYAQVDEYIKSVQTVNVLASHFIKQSKDASRTKNSADRTKNTLGSLLAALDLGNKLQSDGSKAIELVNEQKYEDLLHYCYVDAVAPLFVLQYLHKLNPQGLQKAMRMDNELGHFSKVNPQTVQAMLTTKVPVPDWVQGEAREFHDEFYRKLEQTSAGAPRLPPRAPPRAPPRSPPRSPPRKRSPPPRSPPRSRSPPRKRPSVEDWLKRPSSTTQAIERRLALLRRDMEKK